MPKLNVEDDELDLDELEEAEYDEDGESYTSYDGEQPPKGTLLLGRIKRMWWTYTKNNDPMIKVLFEADENEGDEEEYNGLGIWDNLVLTAGAKFRWAPFLRVMGLTISDVKNKTIVKDKDGDNLGLVITKIAKWEVGGDESWCRVVTDRERYNGEWQTRAGKYLDPDEIPEPEEPEEDEPEEPEEEPEETPAQRSRGRRAAPAKEEAKPAARTQRRTSTATADKPAAKAGRSAPARGRRAAGSSDDPPF